MATKRPTAGLPASHQNILHGLQLHAHMTEAERAKQQLEGIKVEHEKTKKEIEAYKKKAEIDKKHHEETRKELDQLKSKYDANYVFEKRNIKRDTMNRVRSAKTQVKKDVAIKQKEARRTQKAKPTARKK